VLTPIGLNQVEQKLFKNLETKQVKRSIRETRIDEVRRDGLKRVVIAKHTQEFSSSSLNRNFLNQENSTLQRSHVKLCRKKAAGL